MRDRHSGSSDDTGLHPTSFEIAGEFPTGERLGDLCGFADPSPRDALERASLAALQRPPCFVSFSGGRDSSVVLAAATAAARKSGLPEPVPVTLRFPGFRDTDESEWQERVVRHLGLREWTRIELSDELDLLGPVAARALEGHGLLWPMNSHFHVPILRMARGGSLLTGVDGDGLFGSWRWVRIGDVLSGRASPVPRDVLRFANALAPRRLRQSVSASRHGFRPMPWLRPAAHRAASRSWVRERASEPVRWNRRVLWFAGRRYHHMCRWSLARLARETDTRVVHPLLDAGFLVALARAGGRFGFGDRTAILRALFSDLLPDEILERSTKAAFDPIFWGPHSGRFIESWNGEGVDIRLIDPERLREEWSRRRPDARSGLLLQSAWLASRPKLAPSVASPLAGSSSPGGGM